MARRSRRLCWQVAAITALALALAPDDAAARKFQMSGNWVIRNGQVFIPLQFAATVMSTSMQPIVHASMGNLTGALGFPNGPIPGQGGVTATGSGPATLRVPPHRFVENARLAVAHPGTGIAQITTNFGVDAPYAAATLVPGGGPGSFTWCPGDAACVAMAPPAKRATDPPQGMGGTLHNGRVIYRAGANRFGGAMQMGLRRGGVNSAVRQIGPPAQIQHVHFGGSGSALRNLAPGGLGSADHPAIEKFYLSAGFVTQPITFVLGKLIVNPGPKVTTMGGLTPGAMGPLIQTVLVTLPTGKKIGQFTTNYGFAQTTGSVFAQQTKGTGGQDFLSFMGYDMRTALGAGNLQTVAGGLSFRNTIRGKTMYATMHRVRMFIGAPIPSMSPAGFVAAGALILLAVGYALRGRIRGVQRVVPRGEAGQRSGGPSYNSRAAGS